jgi:hypothetical protein
MEERERCIFVVPDTTRDLFYYQCSPILNYFTEIVNERYICVLSIFYASCARKRVCLRVARKRSIKVYASTENNIELCSFATPLFSYTSWRLPAYSAVENTYLFGKNSDCDSRAIYTKHNVLRFTRRSSYYKLYLCEVHFIKVLREIAVV